MGFFSTIGSVFKSVGRAVGRGIEKIGDWTGSTTLQDIGLGIQSACSEVSRNTGKVESYDKDIARLEDTKQINMILTEFALKLEKKADEIEQTAIKESKVYFKELVKELSDSKSDTGINVSKIERTMDKVEKKIRGNLKSYISKRVSIDDNECLEVLKMDAGLAKESAMKNFSEKILQLGLRNLVNDVKNVIKEQSYIITDIIEEKLDDIKFNLNKKIEEFNLLESSKLKTEAEVEKLKNEILAKIQLSEACIDSLN
ncbi:hypothetical protein AXF41_09205 [Clostridium haemolyticum]|uniref:hypothetical protein n=1 Tax=Clostridium haemolyticum TaxID=84025 RepID=UPI0009C5BD7C|nr:hypothetical protein [Clostridium haemolyticum]OOB75243.1 hypothetical protein AXF41_09205 [Clostridium haemolyticum]